MKIRTGFDIAFDSGQATPMILMLSVHPSRMPDVLTPHVIRLDPPVPVHEYRDRFDNICHRILAPPGRIAMSASFVVQDSGLPDAYAPEARQIPVQDLPDEVLVFLLGSRYCDTDKLADRLEPVRLHAGGLGTRPGDRGLHPQPHPLRLHAGGRDALGP